MDPGDLELTTDRLILRPPQLEDFEGWAAFAADAESTRFIGGVQPRAVAWRGFMTMAGSWAMTGFAMFSIVERSTGRWVGRAGPWKPEGWPGNEVGWGIVRDAWGRGYATEACHRLLRFAFEETPLTEVVATFDDANAASRRVLEKVGLTCRGRRWAYAQDSPDWHMTRVAWMRAQERTARPAL